MPQWTEEQLAAIEQTGHSLLVSAAAGSGKTATLSERCAHLICTGFCNANELLVVTFTEEAAAEMKARVDKALRNRLAADPTSHRIRHQLALLPGAQISTIHAFCARLLKQHFQAIELDPAFAVLDEQEAMLLQREVAGELIEDAFTHNAGAFTALVDLYADGKDIRIEDQIIQTHNVLCSQTDPDGWRQTAIDRLREVEENPDFFATRIGGEFLTLVRRRVEQLIQHANSVLDALKLNPGAAGCDTVVEGIRDNLIAIDGLLDGDFAKARDCILADIAPKLGSAPACDDRERAKALMETVRKPVKKGGDVHEMFARDAGQLRAEVIRTIAPAECFLDLVGEFSRRYADAKRRENVVDFSDLEHLALRVLDDPAIAQQYRERFKGIMIDEFQDVNALQWELLSRVASVDETGHPTNLFCVGDVKQSIYRFRLADPMIFQGIAEKWRTRGHVIDMRDNFRSRKPLLDAINFIFRDLMKKQCAELDYDEAQELHGKRAFKPDARSFPGAPIELHLLVDGDPNAPATPAEHEAADDAEAPSSAEKDAEELTRVEREAAYTAQLIHELMNSGRTVAQRDGDSRPLEFGGIAILLRSARFTIVEYSRALAKAGIPVFAESRTGFFQAAEINDLLSILRLLDNQQQDIPLAAALRSPIFALPHADDALARIRLAYRDMPFHAAVVRYAREAHDPLAAELTRILDTLARWRDAALRLSVADLLWQILSETGYPEFCAALKAGQQRVANLMYLHRCARKFSGFRQQGLYRFLQYIQQLQERSDLGQPSPGEAGNAVRVMTIHGSKGLEFPVVILSGVNARWNNSDAAGAILVNREQYLSVSVADRENDIRYPSVANWLAKDRIIRAGLAEELRVLYVAMTRAQEHLVLVGTCEQKQLDKWQQLPSPGRDPIAFTAAGSMLQWIVPLLPRAGRHLELREATVKSESAAKRVADTSAEPTAPTCDHPDIWRFAYPHAALTQHRSSISVTGLSKGDETPQATPDASEDDAVEAPKAPPFPVSASSASPGEAARLRGLAVHLFMEHYNFAPDAPAPAAQLQSLLDAGTLTPEQAAHIDLDEILWLTRESPLSPMLAAATLVREVPMLDSVAPDVGDDAAPASEFDRVLLRGRIDAIAQTAAGLTVIDYKTDRTYPEPNSPREAAYRKQMDLYRNALQRSGLGPIAGVQLVFLKERRIMEV